jgi:hypothetical protein
MGENVGIYSMIVPTSMEYFDLADLQYITVLRKDGRGYSRIYNDSVNDVDAYNALFSHCNEYIYYRSDHHWTHLGAYYAYCALMEINGKEREYYIT